MKDGEGLLKSSVVQLQSGIAMRRTPEIDYPHNCFACNIGKMVKPEIIHSIDYIEEGYVPSHCVECGICSDSYSGYIQICKNHNIKMGFSFKKLKKILRILCNQGEYFDYDIRDIIFSDIKKTY